MLELLIIGGAGVVMTGGAGVVAVVSQGTTMVLVTTLPTGQSVTVGGQEVIVTS